MFVPVSMQLSELVVVWDSSRLAELVVRPCLDQLSELVVVRGSLQLPELVVCSCLDATV